MIEEIKTIILMVAILGFFVFIMIACFIHVIKNQKKIHSFDFKSKKEEKIVKEEKKENINKKDLKINSDINSKTDKKIRIKK